MNRKMSIRVTMNAGNLFTAYKLQGSRNEFLYYSYMTNMKITGLNSLVSCASY